MLQMIERWYLVLLKCVYICIGGERNVDSVFLWSFLSLSLSIPFLFIDSLSVLAAHHKFPPLETVNISS